MKSTLVVLLTVIVVSAQAEMLTLKGIVKDSETNDPIPFAHVVIDDIVSLTNLDGEFIISANSLNPNLQLEVSVIGYDVSKKSIQAPSDYHTIMLKPSVMELEEVSVMSGRVLMDDVFNRFHLNYEVSKQHMVGYYQENLHGTDSIYYLAEGIVDIYVPSSVSYDQTLVNPIRTRKKVFRPLDDELMILKGNASDMAKTSIWRKDSFLADKNRKNYEFFYSGTSRIGEKEVFLIEFEPKNNKGNASGKIYVEEQSLAVVKLEYHPVISGSTYWKDVKWIEEFHEKDGIYELLRVSYSGVWEHYKEDMKYEALLVVNETSVSEVIPHEKFMLGEKDSFFHEADSNFTDDFWVGFNFIKLDLESTGIIERQGMQVTHYAYK